MIPLLDLTHQLALRNLTITILVTPKNLHYLNPLLIKHSSIQPLVLPFPAAAALPAGIENIRDLRFGSFRLFTMVLADLYNPIVNWFHNHPSPPVAVVSDMFLGWTNRLANELKISRYVFSPSGALALSVIYNLSQNIPKRNDVTDKNEMINSVLELIAAGVPMLTWPMGADQFANADLLDELKVGTRVCEGDKMVPDLHELARLVAESVGDLKRGERVRAKELSKASLSSIEIDGSSCRALNHLVDFLSKQ